MQQLTRNLGDVAATIEVIELLQSLGLAVLFAAVLSTVVRRFSRLMGDRSQLTVIIFALMPTMVLIVSVVKSSLALSLGLVGALSIVRFRTPVKDPEELIYLFIAIAVGLGLGANQYLATSLSFVLIMLVLIVIQLLRRTDERRGVFLDIDSPSRGPDVNLETFDGIFSARKIPYELRRYVEGSDQLSATYYIEPGSTQSLQSLLGGLRESAPDAQFVVIDRSRQLA